MSTKLPWYIQPLYPALALAAGPVLAALWAGQREGSAKFSPTERRWWVGVWGLVAIAGVAGTVYFVLGASGAGLAEPSRDGRALLAAVALALTGGTAARLARRGEVEWLPVGIWGLYVTLVLLFSSPLWVWELGEDYAVKPVAAALQTFLPSGAGAASPGRTVYTDGDRLRPSLDFYCRCRVVPVPEAERDRHWRDDPTALWLITAPSPLAWERRGGRVIDRVGKLAIVQHRPPAKS